jgi:hypothetical protein
VAFRRHLDVTRDPICRKCVCTLYLDPQQVGSREEGTQLYRLQEG